MLSPQLEYLNQKHIILASGSPRRHDALKGLGLNFETIPSGFAENFDPKQFQGFHEYVKQTAHQKTLDVYKSNVQDKLSNFLVIGSDSIVILDNQLLEKPLTHEMAYDMIKSLSGKKHHVMSAVVLMFDSPKTGELRIVEFVESTEVVFSTLSDAMIEIYSKTDIPMDKAGGYGIQEFICGSFVERLDGCFYNVTGFPLNRFCQKILELIKDDSL